MGPMLAVSPTQTAAILSSLALSTSNPDPGASYGSVLLTWTLAARDAGLRGSPCNPWNSLIRRSRLLVAEAPDGSRCLSLFIKDPQDYRASHLFAAPRCRGLPAVLRFEIPSSLREDRHYRHCTNPFEDDQPTILTIHGRPGLQDRHNRGAIVSRTYVRARDLWRRDETPFDPAHVRSFLEDPSSLIGLGGLAVTRAFDATDIHWAPSPWARFLLGEAGAEAVVASLKLGMEWIAAAEDPVPGPGGIFNSRPLGREAGV